MSVRATRAEPCTPCARARSPHTASGRAPAGPGWGAQPTPPPPSPLEGEMGRVFTPSPCPALSRGLVGHGTRMYGVSAAVVRCKEFTDTVYSSLQHGRKPCLPSHPCSRVLAALCANPGAPSTPNFARFSSGPVKCGSSNSRPQAAPPSVSMHCRGPPPSCIQKRTRATC